MMMRNVAANSFYNAAARRMQLYSPRPVFTRSPIRPRIAGRFMGLGENGTAPATSWLDTMSNLVKQAIPVYQQVRLLSAQEKRAAAGLPPLSADQLAPTVRVQAGVDPQLGRMLLWGGLGIGGVFLAMSLLKRR